MSSLITRLASRLLAALVVTLGGVATANAGLINGGFESPPVAANSVNFPASIPGWQTTDSAFEIWGTGFNGVPAYEGNQFAELNAFIAGTLYQDVSGITAGSLVGFQFAHRGRAGNDTMRLTITDLGANGVLGGGDDTVLFTDTYTDGTAAWGFYTNGSPILALGNTVRFAYEAVSSAGGASVGNFLDAADFGVGVGAPVPAPSTWVVAAVIGTCGLGAYARRRTPAPA